MAIQPEGLLRVQQSAAEDNSSINTPTPADNGIMDSPGLEGSFQQVLAANLGHYVQIDFLVGVQTLVRRSGIIYAVGRSFVVLYDETNQNFVMCDVFSAKFVAFFATRPAPGVLPNNPMGIMEVDAQGNLWPVDDMEGPTPRPTAQVTPAQVRRAQAEAQRLERQLQQQQAAQLPGVVSPGSVPPPEAAVGPGWVTLTTHQQRAQGQNTPF